MFSEGEVALAGFFVSMDKPRFLCYAGKKGGKMKKMDDFFEKYWVYLHLIVCVYLAANYFKLWERWRAYWAVHIIMAVFFFLYGRFWLLSAGKMSADKERRNRKVTGVLCFGICVGCLILGVYTF